VVTGGNKGIGLEIVRGLAKHKGILPILTARSEEKGKAAADALKKEGLEVGYYCMDVDDKKSIAAFAEWVLQAHGNVDILVNNAAIAFDWMGSAAPPMTEQVAAAMRTNFWGAMDVIDALGPHMDNGGAVVNVASGLGQSAYASTAQKWRKMFADPKLDRKALCQLAETYIEAGKAGKDRQEGWPGSAYGASKMFLMHYTRLLAEELRGRAIACNR